MMTCWLYNDRNGAFESLRSKARKTLQVTLVRDGTATISTQR
uniref:Uncharacterized protein n=1 Tax=Anguilla anguilla TaxID=7936 RepID=A0A0E9V566_ANGAN